MSAAGTGRVPLRAPHDFGERLFNSLRGLLEAYFAVEHVVSNRALWMRQLRLWLPTFGVVVFFWLLTQTVMLPVSLVMNALHLGWMVDAVMEALRFLLMSLPYVVLLFMRYIYWTPLDEMFQATLQSKDQQFAFMLYQLPPQTIIQAMHAFYKRTGRTVVRIVAFFVLAQLPYVGWLVYPIAEFMMLYKTFGAVPAALLALGSVLPYVSSVQHMLTRLLFACRTLPRELLEPYLTRVQMDDKAKSDFFDRHGTFLFGFSLPFALLVNYPVFGPFAFSVAQAAMACAIVLIAPMPVAANSRPGQ